MKIRTSGLSGVALDWAVAQVADVDVKVGPGSKQLSVETQMPGILACWAPSFNWSQGGPLIEREQINLEWDGVDGQAYWWKASHQDVVQFQMGDTPLQAACRAIVAAKLGDEVDVPEGLV